MNVLVEDRDLTIHVGDVRDVLATLPDESVDCVVTSPPYWGLRDYGTGLWEGGDEGCDHQTPRSLAADTKAWKQASSPGSRPNTQQVCGKCGARRVDRQIGLEATPDEYLATMVVVFREVRRVLRREGTCWVNLGDSYASGTGSGLQGANGQRAGRTFTADVMGKPVPAGLKPKDLVGIPWRVAFALQQDGWYLRSDIIWAKPNPMPESVTDRPTKSHEYVFLLTKSARYWFDQEAVRQPATYAGKVVTLGDKSLSRGQANGANLPMSGNALADSVVVTEGRNIRSVWEIATQPYPEAHFATFPEELPRRCIAAGCPERVCGTCGKARERIVEVGYDNPGNRTTNGPRSVQARDDRYLGTIASCGVRLEKRTETLGWSDCGHDNYRPGVVLDPFGGSGTTGLVARNLGRRAILIDLNEQYARLAATRCQQLSLLAEADAAPVPPRPSRGLTGGAYSPPGQSPHSNARNRA